MTRQNFPGLDPATPVVAIGGGFSAENVPPYHQFFNGNLLENGVQPVIIDVAHQGQIDEDGIRRYGIINGKHMTWHDVAPSRLVPDAWRDAYSARSNLPPSWMRPDNGYNPKELRHSLATRKGASILLRDSGIVNREPRWQYVPRDAAPSQLPHAEQLFVKQLWPRDLSLRPEDHARLLPYAEVLRLVRSGNLRDVIVQPRVPTAKTAHIAAAAGAGVGHAQYTEMVDTLHQVQVCDTLWRDEHKLPPQAALQWKPAQPINDAGHLGIARHSNLKVDRLFANFGELATTHNQLWSLMRDRFGSLGTFIVGYLITPSGGAIAHTILTQERINPGKWMSAEAMKLADLAHDNFARR